MRLSFIPSYTTFGYISPFTSTWAPRTKDAIERLQPEYIKQRLDTLKVIMDTGVRISSVRDTVSGDSVLFLEGTNGVSFYYPRYADGKYAIKVRQWLAYLPLPGWLFASISSSGTPPLSPTGASGQEVLRKINRPGLQSANSASGCLRLRNTL
jgi:hypothetical protein